MSDRTFYIIVHPHSLTSPYIYKSVVDYHLDYVGGEFDRIYLIVQKDMIYNCLYNNQATEKVIVRTAPILRCNAELVTYVKTLIVTIGTENSGGHTNYIYVRGYQEFDELRDSVSDPHYRTHTNVFFNDSISFEEVVSTYPHDFQAGTPLTNARTITKLQRKTNIETTLVSRIARVASVPFAYVSHQKHIQYVRDNDGLSTMHLFEIFRMYMHTMNFTAFINNAFYAVVTNDRVAALLHFLQTHKLTVTSNPHTEVPTHFPVIFDLNTRRIEEYPQFTHETGSGQALESSWSFDDINSHKNRTDWPVFPNSGICLPDHFAYIRRLKSLLLVDMEKEARTYTTNMSSALQPLLDTNNGFVYDLGVGSTTPTVDTDTSTSYAKTPYINIDNNTTRDPMFVYDMPPYDTVLGKNHMCFSVFMYVYPVSSGATYVQPGGVPGSILFSYGAYDFNTDTVCDFAVRVFENRTSSDNIDLYVTLGAEDGTGLEPGTTITLPKDKWYLINVSVLTDFSDSGKYAIQLTTYDSELVGNGNGDGQNVGDAIRYVYYKTTMNANSQPPLPRRGGIRVGDEGNNLRVNYFEFMRGVYDGIELAYKVGSILNVVNRDTGSDDPFDKGMLGNLAFMVDENSNPVVVDIPEYDSHFALTERQHIDYLTNTRSFPPPLNYDPDAFDYVSTYLVMRIGVYDTTYVERHGRTNLFTTISYGDTFTVNQITIRGVQGSTRQITTTNDASSGLVQNIHGDMNSYTHHMLVSTPVYRTNPVQALSYIDSVVPSANIAVNYFTNFTCFYVFRITPPPPNTPIFGTDPPRLFSLGDTFYTLEQYVDTTNTPDQMSLILKIQGTEVLRHEMGRGDRDRDYIVHIHIVRHENTIDTFDAAMNIYHLNTMTTKHVSSLTTINVTVSGANADPTTHVVRLGYRVSMNIGDFYQFHDTTITDLQAKQIVQYIVFRWTHRYIPELAT